jgi:shikimate kinase
VFPAIKNGLRVSFVGLPSVGKSAVAREYSLRRDAVFIDSDRLVEDCLGASISTIFADFGELAFRDSEERLIDEVSKLDSYVLATGGGSILRLATRMRLKTRCLVIYLHANVETVVARLEGDSTRPLLNGSSRFEKLQLLYEQRDSLYRETAHSVIECSGLCFEEIFPFIDIAVSNYKPCLANFS